MVTVLKEVKLKDLYSHEINFKGKVGDTNHIYRILALPPRGGHERRRKNFPNAFFVTKFFSITVSDTTVKKAFLEFGEVHDVPSPWNILWWLLASSGHVGCEESIMRKVCVHTCHDTCYPAPDNLANEECLLDNEGNVLAYMKSRSERITTKDAAPISNTVAAAALWGRPLTHSSERQQHLQESLIDSMGSGYPTVVQRAPQIVSSLRATVEPGAHLDPSRVVDPNDWPWF